MARSCAWPDGLHLLAHGLRRVVGVLCGYTRELGFDLAMRAFNEFDGQVDPIDRWVKHSPSERRRP